MMGLRGLSKEDHNALTRVFKTPNPALISKVKMIKAITGHMAFIDYVMIELYVVAPEHELFKSWTPEQLAVIKKEVEFRKEYFEKQKVQTAGNAEKEVTTEETGVPIPEREGSAEEIAAEDKQAEQDEAAEIASDALTEPTAEPVIDPDRLVHLCDTCRAEIPECAANASDIEYGDGPGGDNIIKCKEHKLKASLEEGSDGTDVR